MTVIHRRSAGAEPAEARVIGRSAPIVKLLRRIQLVAPTDATVLIRGERGTEKELVADALQQASRRRGRPYLKLNCAGLAFDLLASELFGHERGAFTDAFQRKPGLLTVADGGTLFLDEIGDLSPQAQAMLFPFLDRGEVKPLGSTQPFRVDVRLIAATDRDPEEAIQQKEFRAALYDRLSEVVLEVPPLRERREDIPLLVEHFRAVSGRRHGVTVSGVAPEALRALQSYAWPGNVRELENTVSRAVIYAQGGRIVPHDLGLEMPGRSDLTEERSALCTVRQQEALMLAARHGTVRRADLMTRFGISGETARRDLSALVRTGLLRRVGVSRGSRYVVLRGSGSTP